MRVDPNQVDKRFKLSDNQKAMNTLLRITTSLIETLDLQKILQIISDGMSEMLGIETAAIYTLDNESELYLGATTPPLDPNLPDWIRRAPLSGHTHIQRAISTRTFQFVLDTRIEEFSPEEKNIVEFRNLRSLVYFPFVLEQNVLGVLILGTVNKIRHFTQEEIELTQTIANQLSISIQNARLHLRLKEKNQDLESEIARRRNMEQELKDGEEKYRVFFENNDAKILFVNPRNGNIIFANQSACEFYGYEEHILIGKHISLINTLSPLEIKQKMAEAMKSKNNRFLFQHKNAKGEIKDVEIYQTKLRLRDSEIFSLIVFDVTDRIHVEQKLKVSEEKFRKAFLTSPDSININKLDGTFVDINEGFTKITGYSKGDVIGKLSSEVEIWAYPTERELLVKDLQERGYTNNMEASFRMKNGSIIDGLISARLVDINGEDHILSITRDVTEWKKIQKKLEESELRYRNTFEAINEGLWDWNLIDNSGSYSDSFYKMLGYRISDIENTNEAWAKLIHPNDLEEFNKAIFRHINGEISEFVTEYRLLTKNGEYKWVKAKGKIMESTFDGSPKRILAAIEDIDRTKRAEIELELSYVNYKTIADYTFDWEYWKDPENNFIYISPSAKRITGYSPKKFIDNPSLFRELIHEDDRDIWTHHEHRSDKRIPCSKPVEFRIIRKNGKIRWINHICQPVYDQQGKYIGNRGTNRDVTEQKIAQLSLVASESKYRQLFKNITSGFALLQVIHSQTGSDEFRFLEINPAFQKLTRLKGTKIAGKEINEVMPRIAKEWAQKLQNIINSGKSEYFESYIPELDKYLSIMLFQGSKNIISALINDITEKKQIEDDLLKSEQKLSLHLEQSPLAIIEWATDPIVIKWNKAAEKIFGYESWEIIGENGIEKLVPAYDQKDIWKVWKQILVGSNRRNTNQNITKDGKIILCEWYNTTIVDRDGELIGVISIVEDITEREMVQRNLKTSEERHKLISQISSDFVYSMKYDNTGFLEFDWVSGAINRITGYTTDEINSLPKKWESVIYQEDIGRVKSTNLLGRLAISQSIEYRIVLKNGSVRWISNTFVPTFTKIGDKTGYIGSIVDINEKKQAEENLLRSTKRLQTLAEVSEEGIIIHRKGIVLETSKAATKITGYPEDELIGSHISKLIHPADVPQTKKSIKSPGSFSYTARAIRKSGSPYFIEIHSQPVEYQGERAKVATFSDISEKIETEQKLKQNKDYLQKAQKIAHIGHFHWDGTNDTLFLSEELRQIYELSDREYSFREIFFNFIYPEDKNRIKDHWFSAKSPQYKFDQEFRIAINKKQKWLRVVAEIHHDEKGTMISALGLCYDITQRKLADLRIMKNDQELIVLSQKIAEYKMMALRSVMNPHFIFNCLNSIQFFIAKNEKKSAISYLSLFSKLMRNVLNASVERYVTLKTEVETLEYYVELEKLRFDDNFDFVLEIDEEIDEESIEIPSMVIQPYVENAIIHGLSNKQDTGTLLLKIDFEDNALICMVEDNGIGREASQKLQALYNKTKHKSLGMTITEERLSIINKTDNVQVEIIDLIKENKAAGTRVVMKIELKQDSE